MEASSIEAKKAMGSKERLSLVEQLGSSERLIADRRHDGRRSENERGQPQQAVVAAQPRY